MRRRLRLLGVMAAAVAALVTACTGGTRVGGTGGTQAPALVVPRASAPTTLAELESQLDSALSQVASTASDTRIRPEQVGWGCDRGYVNQAAAAYLSAPKGHGDALRGYLKALGWTVADSKAAPDLYPGSRELDADYGGSRLVIGDVPESAATPEELLVWAYTPCVRQEAVNTVTAPASAPARGVRPPSPAARCGRPGRVACP